MSSFFINGIISIKRKVKCNNRNISVRGNIRLRFKTRDKNNGEDNRRFNHVKKNPRKASESIRSIDPKHYRFIRSYNDNLRIKVERYN